MAILEEYWNDVTEIKWHFKTNYFKGYGTPNQNLACFVHYLKTDQHLFEK